MLSEQEKRAKREKRNAYVRAWLRKKRQDPEWVEKQRSYCRKYRLSGKLTSVHRMLCSAKARAKKAKLPFDLKLEDVVIPEVCPLLGIPIVEGHMKGKQGPSPNSPSLDRIRPELGYVKGNLWVISHRANIIKQDATPDELELIAKQLRKKIRKLARGLSAA